MTTALVPTAPRPFLVPAHLRPALKGLAAIADARVAATFVAYGREAATCEECGWETTVSNMDHHDWEVSICRRCS